MDQHAAKNPDDLNVIEEEKDGNAGSGLLSPKPKYFDEFDDIWVDSEDEMVAGENNYIQINCFNEADRAKPEEENKEEQAL